MIINESYIHIAIRNFFRSRSWQLIAGEFPGGSDDELQALNITDLALAKDNSPDPRRHSKGKFVPDLFVRKGKIILVIEAKPNYSIKDEQKLIELLINRKQELLIAFEKFVNDKKILIPYSISELIFVPCLAFQHRSKVREINPNFLYLIVKNLEDVALWNLDTSIKLEGEDIE